MANQPTLILDFHSYFAMRRYCIYFWVRNGKPLYIGKSGQGVNRPCSRSHHVINSYEMFREGDTLLVFECDNEEQMDAREKKMIKKFNPPFNVIYANEGRGEVLMECGFCGHDYWKSSLGPNQCGGRCNGDDDCACRINKEYEELKFEDVHKPAKDIKEVKKGIVWARRGRRAEAWDPNADKKLDALAGEFDVEL